MDTKFLEQIKPGSQIALKQGRAAVEVTEVISDTELLIKKEISDPLSLIALTSKEGANYSCIPHLDHSIVYKAVHETLDNNECVGIFPEGGSHDRTQLLPLKGIHSFIYVYKIYLIILSIVYQRVLLLCP